VDKSGTTQGPLSVEALKDKYGKDMTDGSYVWNGADVNQWTHLSNVPTLLKQFTASIKCARISFFPE